MDDQIEYYLSHIYNDELGKLNITAISKLDSETYEEYRHAKIIVETYFSSQNVIESVYANRNDILESIVLAAKIRLERASEIEGLMHETSFEVSRHVANTCSLFRSFIDHSDRYYKSTYGTSSLEYIKYKKLLSQEYDNHKSYRLFYFMRNFIQHYDMPPLSLSFSEDAEEEGVNIAVNLDMKSLMKDSEMRKKFSKTGDCVEDDVSLFSLLEEWSACFTRIANFVNEDRKQKAASYANTIVNCRDSFGIPPNGRLALTSFPYKDEELIKLQINLVWLPEIKARSLLFD